MDVSRDRPSKKQRELLAFLDGFIKGHGYGPSYREIMRALDYKSVSTVATHINGLIAKGWVTKRSNSARSLEVLDAHDAPAAPSAIVRSQEKWLVDVINAKFDAYETAPSAKGYDELCILVGALSVLGLSEAATAAKARLGTLQKQGK